MVGANVLDKFYSMGYNPFMIFHFLIVIMK